MGRRGDRGEGESEWRADKVELAREVRTGRPISDLNIEQPRLTALIYERHTHCTILTGVECSTQSRAEARVSPPHVALAH